MALSARAALTATGRDAFHRVPNRKQNVTDAVERVPTVSRKDQKRLEAQQRQASSHKRKAQQQIVHNLEKEIQTLEARQTEILAELEKADTYEKPGRAQELNRELGHVQHDLAELNPKWEEQATRLTAME